ncbi:hypothetical protein [Sorangium cellulosum]|uniref:hypothetical protein n=1 Tax=Sorangium cellulosum TaxID=56 RepID=UPI001F1D7BD6|nr:hypothetical protein [Sorangium cellulosum]
MIAIPRARAATSLPTWPVADRLESTPLSGAGTGCWRSRCARGPQQHCAPAPLGRDSCPGEQTVAPVVDDRTNGVGAEIDPDDEGPGTHDVLTRMTLKDAATVNDHISDVNPKSASTCATGLAATGTCDDPTFAGIPRCGRGCVTVPGAKPPGAPDELPHADLASMM